MKRNDIIRIAQEAGWDAHHAEFDTRIQTFAALVASAECARIKQANAPEIERVNAHIKELEDAVKEALAQPEQDWIKRERAVGYREGHRAALAKRTWVGLTDYEILLISADCASAHQHMDIQFARAIEAKLKDKNT